MNIYLVFFEVFLNQCENCKLRLVILTCGSLILLLVLF